MRSSTRSSRSAALIGLSIDRVISRALVQWAGHALLCHRPEPVAEHRVALLDAVDALRVHGETEVDILGSRAIRPPSCPEKPIVSRPRCFASVNAVIRSSELPDVDNAIAMSRSRAWAMIWRLKIRSNPTSLPRAVTTALSAARTTPRPDGRAQAG